jgi:sensor histidine kinase YesM
MNDKNKVFEGNPLLDFIVNPKKRLYRHILMFFFLALLLMFGNSSPFDTRIRSEVILLLVGIGVLCIGIIYLNFYYLIPKLLFKNNYRRYFLLVFLLITSLFLLLTGVVYRFSSEFSHEIMEDMGGYTLGVKEYMKAYFSFILLFGSFLGASTAIKLFQHWIMDKSHIYELENSTIQSELELLKNQLTPHFLFNTLNNTNVLIATDPEKASQVVFMLSDLLRYQLYDSSQPTVLLASDIRFLTDFLHLEKIRRDAFEFSISNDCDMATVVPPMLFIPFVENAVKHSAGGADGSYVYVSFRETGGDTLWFSCINSIPVIPNHSKTVGGIGLANVKRRLELLYGDMYSLEINEKETIYQVNLYIKLCGVL